MVREPSSRGGGLSPKHEGGFADSSIRQQTQNSADCEGRGVRVCRWLCAGSGRYRPEPKKNEPHSRGQRGRFCCGGSAGRDHGGVAECGGGKATLLSPRPGEPFGLQHRRKHRHECRWAALPEVRGDTRLCARVGGGVAGRLNRKTGRPVSQEQNRLRPRPLFCRLGGPAWNRYRGHAEAAAQAAVQGVCRCGIPVDA